MALAINSPGGSPVQSSLIGGHIRRVADELAIPVHAFVEDVAASGGYWLAAAADDIWLDESSIVGSIGVISAGFGFPELLERVGIERRVHTAGEDKSLLDPFRPERSEDIDRLRALQVHVHEHFIEHVTARRGSRIDASRGLFGGEVFVGTQGGRGRSRGRDRPLVPKLRSLYGEDVKVRALTLRRPLLRRLLPGIDAGAVVAAGVDAVETRAAWSRFGL